MPETPITQTNETAARRPVEIIHYPESDVIINNDADLAAYGHRLAELFKDDYPPNWQPIKLDEVDMYHGSVDGVDFLVKPKIWSGVEMYGPQKEARVAFAPNEQERRSHIRAAQLLNGIRSEIGLAPTIKRLVAGETLQAAAHEWGFKSFSLVEPVIGVIYKPEGVKCLVYEYIKGAENIADKSLKDKYGITDEKGIMIVDYLHNLFAAHNIEAADVNYRQLIADSEDNLYLTDIELYQRLPPIIR